MNILKNMKVRNKLNISFATIIILGALAFVAILYNVFNIKTYDNNNNIHILAPTETVSNIQSEFQDARIYKYRAISMSLAGRDATEFANKARESYAALEASIDEYIQYETDINDKHSPGAIEAITPLHDAVHAYAEIFEETITYAENGQGEAALATDLSTVNYTDAIEQTMLDYTSTKEMFAENLSKKISRSISLVFKFVLATVIFLPILSFIIALLIGKEIDKKVQHLMRSVKDISKGDFSGNIALPETDEFGLLSQELAQTAGIIDAIIEEIHAFSERQDDGRLSENIDASKYEGEYANMINVLNNSYTKIFDVFAEFLAAMDEISGGNFAFEYPQQPNEKAVLNTAYGKIQDNFNEINTELDSIVTAVSNGNFDVTANADKFEGEWAQLLHKLNSLVECVKLPIEDVKDALIELSNGNLSADVQGEYTGAFNEMKVSLNTTINVLRNIINSIAYSLNEVANKNLDIEVDAEFVGDFNEIKDSIDLIVSELNKIFSEFKVGADEVAVGGKQIADSSIHLSEQATEQSNSIKELTTLLENIFDKTRDNAKSSQDANLIAKTSLANANEGDEKMKQMLEAMEAISSSSNEIANIIKVIDDIAFQTNLLALNAAVEAARAGAHGKGFAVVADEVRQLASRSSNAAKETSQLITKSITSVNLGSELALSTNEALSTIVKNVEQVSSIINDINVASKNQLDVVEVVSGNLENIEGVVDSVLASSEEGVSTAEELSSQSVILNQYISEFKLARD